MEPLRRIAGAQHFLPAASAVELASSCIGFSFPLDPASDTERGTMSVGEALTASLGGYHPSQAGQPPASKVPALGA